MSTVPFEIQQNSILVHAEANGQPVVFIVDSGDAIGPVFNAADAERLGLQATGEIGVSGAGGASVSYTTVATITFGDATYAGEPSAIDTSLQGPSLLGLPYFQARFRYVVLDLEHSTFALA